MSDKPVATLRLSPVSATIWKNQTKDGKAFFSVTFARNYKDAGGNWKSADSFSGADLLLLAKLANMAHTHVEEFRKADATAEEGQADEGAV